MRPALFILLLCLTLGASIKLPERTLLVLSPPNTNSYGCTLAWDAVPNAEYYRVFLGESPTTLKPVTTATAPLAGFRIWETNTAPWVGVTAVAGGIESDMSQLLTVTNYLNGWVELQSGNWQKLSGTDFSIQTTGAMGLTRMHGHQTNNWPKSP